MTAVAVPTKTTAVDIIRTMTSKTAVGELFLVFKWNPMTGLADNLAVFPLEFEIGLRVVIEGP